MYETLQNSQPHRDAWNEPIRGRSEPFSLWALAAMGISFLTFAIGPMRWLPIVNWLDPLGDTMWGGLLSVVSLFFLLPSFMLCYEALILCKTGLIPERPMCWLALVFCYASLLCWFGLLVSVVEAPERTFRLGMIALVGILVLHAFFLAEECRAGAYAVGLILFLVLSVALTSCCLSESREEARQIRQSNNMTRLFSPLQQLELIEQEVYWSTESARVYRAFLPQRMVPSNRSISDLEGYRSRSFNDDWEQWNLQYEQAAAAAAER